MCMRKGVMKKFECHFSVFALVHACSMVLTCMFHGTRLFLYAHARLDYVIDSSDSIPN